MLELMILTMSVLPFVLGLYALKILERRRRDDDDLPPPPGDDPLPPIDPWPVSPAGRRRLGDRDPSPSPANRRPVSSPAAFRPSRVTPSTHDRVTLSTRDWTASTRERAVRSASAPHSQVPAHVPALPAHVPAL